MLYQGWGLFQSYARAHVSCSCGSSVAEAVSLGCKYDSLSSAWLPQHCRDDELTDEFNNQIPKEFGGSWPYYLDMNDTSRVVTEEEIAAQADREDIYYTVHKYHIAHCIFNWMREHRAAEGRSFLPRGSSGIQHPRHCYDVVMLRNPLDTVNVAFTPQVNADIVERPSRYNRHQ
ncbi:hypothetical protein LZ30DRAFT_605642 [Colletotrichum cereale]|nr:hypothetical protein LZ30DRAFT_605642 [Colletotrichum cereale]